MIRGVLRNFAKLTGKSLCRSLFFNKEALTQVFFSEFSDAFFTKHLWATASP